MDYIPKLSPSLTIASGILAFLILRAAFKSFTNPLSRLPGPQISKFSSLVLTYYWLAGRRVNYVHSLHQKYGPVVRISPTEVDICDVKAAREIHRIGVKYLKTQWYRTLGPPAMPNLFTATDPKFHLGRRRLLAPFFAEASVEGFQPIILDRVRTLVSKVGEDFKKDGVADMYKWWTLMAIDIMGELSFGESFRMLELGKKNQYATHISNGSAMHPIRTTFPTLVRLAMILPLPYFKAAARIGPEVFQYAVDCVSRYKVLLDTNPDPKKTLFTNLFGKGKEGMSDMDITFEAQSYITAGTDTTATTLTYLVYAVCSDRKIRDKLVAELEPLSETLVYADTLNLKWLNAVVNETLRMYSPAPSALPRVVPVEGVELAGKHVAGGATVSTQVYSLHRDPSIFADPDRFDPSRWEDPTPAMQEAFMPFSAGTRSCIGIHLAKMELRLATAYFFKSYPTVRMSTREKTIQADMVPKTFFLMFPKGHKCMVEV